MPQTLSPPTAAFSDETQRNPESRFMIFDSYDWSLLSFFLFPCPWPVFLALYIFENAPNGFVSWVSVSIPIVRHLTTSGDWSNSYHPIELEGCSFLLAVALWFPTYVSMPVAFHLKDQLQTANWYFSCVHLKLSIKNSVIIREMRGTDTPKITVQKIALTLLHLILLLTL